VQTVEFVHFLFRRKIATARRLNSDADCGSFFIGQSVHTTTARFDFAGDAGEFFLILFRPGLNLLQQISCSGCHAANIAHLHHFATGRLAHSTFAGSGASRAAFATFAAFAVSARAAIRFCPSLPGCTTPQDMIRVAASSALMGTSMILLLGT